MPWNASALRYGSVRPFVSGLTGGISSSVGGLASGRELGPPSILAGRRGSRLTSASPLLGKGGPMPRYSSLELPEQAGTATSENFNEGGIALGGDLGVEEESQLYGPAAGVDTQTAAQSQWVAMALDTEAYNFLTFLASEIEVKAATRDDNMSSATLDGLLPPAQNSKVR